MYYWRDNGEDEFNALNKAAYNRIRAKNFAKARNNAFNRDYGYENGHFTDDDYKSVEMRGQFYPQVNGYNKKRKYGGEINPLRGQGVISHDGRDLDITPEEYFDGDEEAAQSYRNARSEFDKYRRNDYKFVKGKGWQ